MLGQIVEIEGEGRRLSLSRGFLEISGPDGRLGAAPLDDIEAVIFSNPAASLTTQAIAALALRGAALVICGPDFRPVAYMLPVDGHHAQGDRVEAQAESSLPVRKRLWAELVRAKIVAQAAAVERAGGAPGAIRALADRVRSGDPDNLEAQAAQRYFPALFGKGFHRRREAGGANAMLNYGYTVLRAATARAVIGAGLHPSLSLHHRSKGDALRLVDDVMEPFRPTIDLAVKALLDDGVATLDTPAKRRLAHALHADFATDEGITPLSTVLSRVAISLAQVFTGERKSLALPHSPIPVPAAELPEQDDGDA
jgi:CRISPR-associated protein Cas1